MPDKQALQGCRIALPENRELDLLASMLERQGAIPLRFPLIAILDPLDLLPVYQWLDQLESGAFSDVLFYTGEGLRRLLNFAGRRGTRERMIEKLTAVRKICRGPKPARALREIELSPDLRAEPATTAGIVDSLSGVDWQGRTLGIQLFDDTVPPALQEYLATAAITYHVVTPYRYAPKMEGDRVGELIDQIIAGEIDVVAFTSAAQVTRLWEVATDRLLVDRLRQGLTQCTVAAVGPVVAQALEVQGVSVQVMPEEKFFMKPLVDALVAAIGTK